MNERVTVEFRNANDNLYLYDDSTSLILNRSTLREKILSLLEKKTVQKVIGELSLSYDKNVISREVEYIYDLKNNYGAFYRSKPIMDDIIESKNLKEYIEVNIAYRAIDYLQSLVRELVKLPDETEWIEFKCNNKNPQMIGEYISALSNSAAL